MQVRARLSPPFLLYGINFDMFPPPTCQSTQCYILLDGAFTMLYYFDLSNLVVVQVVLITCRSKDL